MSHLCETCGRPFGKRKRCYYCQPGRRRSGVPANCQQCGRVFHRPQWKIDRGEGRFCSYPCAYESLRGVEKREGTRYLRKDGYVQVKTGIRQVAMEHRLVMERELGRPLASDEEVHRLNGNRSDNRPENLTVMKRDDHTRVTNALATAKHRSERAELAEYRRLYGPLPKKED